MSRAISRALILLSAVATLGGCAHAARTAQQKPVYPERVLVTGSRIPQPVDQRTGVPAGMSSLHFYSYSRLLQTGHYDDIAGALSSTAPDLSVQPGPWTGWEPMSLQLRLNGHAQPAPEKTPSKPLEPQSGYDQPQRTTSPQSP